MSIESLEYVQVSRETGIPGVAEVTINRPKALNALNRSVLGELERAFAHLREGVDVRCVILTGAGEKAFVAGADIAEMSEMSPRDAEEFSRRGHAVLDAIEGFPSPVLAAVNGFALGGGCELALACDVIYASTSAKFGQPEVKLGLMPGFGGSVRLARKVGYAAAAEWIFTGEIYGAEAAEKVGLVRELVEPAQLMTRVREVARAISLRAPLAVQASKRVMLRGLSTDPATASRMEQWAFGGLFASEDMREGTKAFLDKRQPTFGGK